MKYLNITIGPVQGYVSQARRTRDFWSGSFILSYLSGCAIYGASKAGGRILEPKIEGDHLFNLITLVKEEGEVNVDATDLIGSIPNRIKIECEEPVSVAKAAKEEFDKSWYEIADMVWNKYVKESEQYGLHTDKIWDRQVGSFWEFNWTMGGQNTIEERKNWRSQNKPDEGGDHCSLMSDYQEISGHVRFRKKYREKQDEFWNSIREGVGELDLKDDERLCAISFVKRFFPRISKKIIGVDLTSDQWPSTVYMAAIPWLRNLEKNHEDYFGLVKSARKGAVSPKIPELVGLKDNDNLAKLDGNFFFKNMIESKDSTPLDDEILRSEILEMLNKIYREEKCKPAPYYALLKMDGDSLGKMKSNNIDKISTISDTLAKFSKSVPGIIRENNGVTIYAGGDDVLAMLPMDRALKCSRELYQNYLTSFSDIDLDSKATISAGLVYSHYHQPIQSILDKASYLLDEIAKEKNGRDSIAISVIKGSGEYIRCVHNWGENAGVVDNIMDSVGRFESEGLLSSSMMYSVRDSFSLLGDIHNWKPGDDMEFVSDSDLDMEKLLVADAIRSGEGSADREKISGAIKTIVDLCKKKENIFSIDTWFLIHFLAGNMKGVKE